MGTLYITRRNSIIGKTRRHNGPVVVGSGGLIWESMIVGVVSIRIKRGGAVMHSFLQREDPVPFGIREEPWGFCDEGGLMAHCVIDANSGQGGKFKTTKPEQESE